MPTIHKLKPEIVSKIAAGEVAERPVSIVKELIENALDAKAEHIDIFLGQGGIKAIVVRDDGIGMTREDLHLSYLPHTTSKIKEEDDLYKIASFGFRGEALASIAAVSSLTIQSRHRTSDAGMLIEIENGTLVRESPSGMPPGTEVRIEGLFATTPARRKFLKDGKHELRAVSELVNRFALVFPEVGFTLANDGIELFNVPHDQTQAERIQALIGIDMRDHIIPVTHESRYGKISGFIGKPQIATKSSTYQYIFLNKRPIYQSELSKHVTETYGSLIEPRTSAPHFIFLDVPFDSVDVNVHPRKEEVLFLHPLEIKKLIAESIEHSFAAHNLAYHNPSQGSSMKPGMDSGMAGVLKNLVKPWHPNELKPEDILQVENIYLIAQTSDGIVIADQHAVHERILFEQFKDALQRAPLQEYRLPEPIVFELSLSETLVLEEHLETLQKLGFSLELFGARTFKLSAVPELLKNRDHKKHILEVIGDLAEHGTIAGIDRETERTLAYLACRSAIKAGDPLSHDERKRLIEKLMETKTPYTCPHGRPTHVELSLYELDRMFKRK